MIEPGQIPAQIRPESAAEGLSGLAQRQHGLVSRAQLHAQGVAGTAITRWLRAGRLHRIHPHVYALGHRAISLEGQLWAALLYAGGGAVLSHTTAAWIWSLIDAEPTAIHLTARAAAASLPGVRVHRRRLVERAECRGLPVTSVARTLLDLAGTLSFRQLRRAMSEADYRGLLDPSEIEAVLGRGRSGSRALRRALDTHLPELAQTLSVLEERFFELCEMAGLPLPEANASVGSHASRRPLARAARCGRARRRRRPWELGADQARSAARAGSAGERVASGPVHVGADHDPAPMRSRRICGGCRGPDGFSGRFRPDMGRNLPRF